MTTAVMADPDKSFFEKALEALAPVAQAWQSYETEKTERRKIDILAEFQKQQQQAAAVDYDQRMRAYLGAGGSSAALPGAFSQSGAVGDGGLLVVAAVLAVGVGLVLVLK